MRRRRGMKQHQLAERLAVKAASVSRYENEDGRLTLPLLRQIADVLECDIADLIGEGSADAAPKISVPEIEALLSAGAGAAEQTNAVAKVWSFDRAYVSAIGANPAGLYIAECKGDSMEPTIRSGERVLIDTNDTQVSRGGIFAIESEGELLLKRVEGVPGAKLWKISSDNPAHSSFEVEAGSVRIIGRAVLSLHRL